MKSNTQIVQEIVNLLKENNKSSGDIKKINQMVSIEMELPAELEIIHKDPQTIQNHSKTNLSHFPELSEVRHLIKKYNITSDIHKIILIAYSMEHHGIPLYSKADIKNKAEDSRITLANFDNAFNNCKLPKYKYFIPKSNKNDNQYKLSDKGLDLAEKLLNDENKGEKI